MEKRKKTKQLRARAGLAQEKKSDQKVIKIMKCHQRLPDNPFKQPTKTIEKEIKRFVT